jgi:hypothetical protein
MVSASSYPERTITGSTRSWPVTAASPSAVARASGRGVGRNRSTACRMRTRSSWSKPSAWTAPAGRRPRPRVAGRQLAGGPATTFSAPTPPAVRFRLSRASAYAGACSGSCGRCRSLSSIPGNEAARNRRQSNIRRLVHQRLISITRNVPCHIRSHISKLSGRTLIGSANYFGDLFGWQFHTPSPVASEVSDPDDDGFLDFITTADGTGIRGGVGGRVDLRASRSVLRWRARCLGSHATGREPRRHPCPWTRDLAKLPRGWSVHRPRGKSRRRRRRGLISRPTYQSSHHRRRIAAAARRRRPRPQPAVDRTT